MFGISGWSVLWTVSSSLPHWLSVIPGTWQCLLGSCGDWVQRPADQLRLPGSDNGPEGWQHSHHLHLRCCGIHDLRSDAPLLPLQADVQCWLYSTGFQASDTVDGKQHNS